ncbi:MAG: type III pantothenate kinase [Desulfuromonadaceae bacterium]|nr:type III pantothenate kinase [Desulfuromonadaceae bacterium]
MLLVVDVGNTNTVLGVYREDSLLHSWRIGTDKTRTDDECAMLVNDLLTYRGLAMADVTAVIVSCVVPPVLNALVRMCRSYFSAEPYVVSAGMKTGMAIAYDNPQEVGADRIVNAVAAYRKHQCSLIVVDFGTATTFDYICENGCYQGGAIAPGLGISADALHARASKLPRVALELPPQVVARNTVHSIQSGMMFGYAGLVDGIVNRMKQEVGGTPKVVATGGLAGPIAEVSTTIDEVDPLLTLDGLRLIYQLNQHHNEDG